LPPLNRRHTMTESEIIAYWSQAATPLGRLRLRLRATRKRWLWTLVLGFARLLKRVFDLLVSGCALLALAPLFALTALAIRLEGPGPVFFGQQRVGYRGRPFRMWKFRSMVPDADALKDKLLAQNQMAGGVTFKMKNDPRITRVGRFIRKYSIDELPQFWNVFRGEMSVVGPRPPVPREVALYALEDRQRLLAQPGLTCFWQVGGRSEIDFAGQVRLDVAYIQSSSLWVDLKLLFLTIPAVLLGKGAM
jgi:exopolysaccharide biosynthesis polyprenyl glycosylphosphotransferase